MALPSVSEAASDSVRGAACEASAVPAVAAARSPIGASPRRESGGR